MSAPAPALPADLTAGLRRLKLGAMRQLAPELLLTAKTQRWAPEEVLRTLIPAACRSQTSHVDRQGVSRLRPFDIERSGLRVQVSEIQHLAGNIVHGRERVVEGVLRPKLEDCSRPYSHHRRGAAEGIDEL